MKEAKKPLADPLAVLDLLTVRLAAFAILLAVLFVAVLLKHSLLLP